MKTEKVISHIVSWLDDYATESKTKGFVVGISGGIDSAVTSSLVALTGKPVLCLEMPIHQAASQVSRGRQHIVHLKEKHTHVNSIEIDLTPTFDEFLKSIPDDSDHPNQFLSLANTRARIRMATLYYFAGLHGYLVAGTGNKVEDFGVGFYTKYGDGGVDISPIADLMKTEVYALGKALGINQEIMNAAPTDGLWGDDRSDEDQLGASYPELEWAMRHIENSEIATHTELTPRQKEVLEIYNRLHYANQHKMNPIPVCVIPEELKD